MRHGFNNRSSPYNSMCAHTDVKLFHDINFDDIHDSVSNLV